MSGNEAMLPLDGQRAVTFRDKGQQFTYYFRRVTDGDYRKVYFPAISVESENEGGVLRTRYDDQTPALALLEHVLERVEGYNLRAGAEITTLPDWKQKLPYGHKAKAAELLRGVYPSTAAGEDAAGYFDPDCTEIRLDADWGIEEDGHGKRTLRRYVGLVHKLRPPSAAQAQRWNRAAGESRVAGGSRRLRTIRAGKHAMMADLYDELVIGVEGYSIGGQALETPERVKREMDTLHKVSAVQILFATPEEDPAAEAEAVA